MTGTVDQPDRTTKRLKTLSAVPIRNGVGEAAQDYRDDWPRYVRTTDIESRVRLKSDGLRSLPPSIARLAELNVGDVLFSAVGSIGKVYWHRNAAGPACFAGFLVRLHPHTADLAAWITYWAQTPHFRDQVARGAVTSTVANFSAGKYKNLRVLLPMSLEDLPALVRYLDHREVDIARALDSQHQLIRLLDERRRAISQHLVLRTSDGDSRRADPVLQGVAVPGHWEVRPAKWFYREVNERSEQGDEQLLSVSHLTGVTPRAAKNVTMFMAESYAGHKLCRPGDLVINTMWAWMGALGVAQDTGIVSPAYGVYRPVANSDLRPDYADLLLRSRPYIDEYTCRSTGIRSSRLRLYPDRFLTTPIVCPPAEEQQEIVGRVRDATRDMDAAIAGAFREIELLQEYRTRLIADVVTGRRDVRAEAADLPEVDPAELDAVLATSPGDDDVEEDDQE